MIIYLIKSALCMVLMLTMYRLLLEKEKMYIFNRGYLLGSLIFCLIVPLIPSIGMFQTTALSPGITAFAEPFSSVMSDSSKAASISSITSTPTLSIGYIILILYCVVIIALLTRLIRNLYFIHLRASRNQHIAMEGARLVLVLENIISHSFNNSIFISESDYKSSTLEQAIIIHELAHVKQRHSFDILFIELLLVLFWFNPLLILFKRSIQLNHEFLADEAVINEYKNAKEYQYILLNKITGSTHMSLISAINYNLTKKRLIMLTQTHNANTILLKKCLMLPLALVAFLVFRADSNAQIQNKQETKNNRISAISGMENVSEDPFVQIDGKEYSSDILYMISPSCIKGSATWSADYAVKKWGPKAAHGAVIIDTKGSIKLMTVIDRENLIKEQTAKTGFYHRVRLTKEDGAIFDKLFVNDPGGTGRASCSGEKDCKVGFLVGDLLFEESQADEVEKLLTLSPSEKIGVGGGNTIKHNSGLDLSSYAVIFYFD